MTEHSDSTSCEHLAEPERRLCRGEIDLQQYRDWKRRGIVPEAFRAAPLLAEEFALEETTACVHRGPDTGRELTGLPCHCDKRIFACSIAGPAGCTKSREIIGGMLPDGRVIRRSMIEAGDPAIPRHCRLCPEREA